MKSVASPAPERARCLVVFLPGIADRAETFEHEGFVDAVRKRKLSIDVVSADATLGYYTRGIEAAAIDRDVIAPAVANRYEQVWMVGVSLGGWGTLHYAASYPSRLDGVLVLAPHLGEEVVLQGIRDSGGLDAWSPADSPFGADNYTVATWSWLRDRTAGNRQGPEVYLGYSTLDFVTGRAELLSRALPASHVYVDPGGLHSWASWRRLFDQFLDDDDAPLAKRCGVATQ
jgi:pimeloyl-ACP methyl ester carboxylesterase